MHFKQWLRKQRKRRDRVGDLARDVMADPVLQSGCPFTRSYLVENGASPEALDAYDAAHEEFDWERSLSPRS